MNSETSQDGWHLGRSILDPRALELLRAASAESPLILEHRFYRGSRAPSRLIFDDFDDLKEHLMTHAQPGDAFHIWRYDALCRDGNQIVSGKYPNEAGLVPERGAY